jgi:hypothetical protein
VDFGAEIAELEERMSLGLKAGADHGGGPWHVLHDPGRRPHMTHDLEELNNVLQALGYVAATAPVRIGEFGARGAAHDQRYVRWEVLQHKRADIGYDMAGAEVGVVCPHGSGPDFIGADHLDTGAGQPSAPAADAGIEVDRPHLPDLGFIGGL